METTKEERDEVWWLCHVCVYVIGVRGWVLGWRDLEVQRLNPPTLRKPAIVDSALWMQSISVI